MARKNLYFSIAGTLEGQGKRSGAMKFYEKLMKMTLDTSEKDQVKGKLLALYKALGMYRESKMLEGQ